MAFKDFLKRYAGFSTWVGSYDLSHQYEHFIITLRRDSYSFDSVVVKWTWQTDRDHTDSCCWYAGRCEIEAEDAEYMTDVATLLRRMGYNRDMTPADVVAALEKLNLTRVAEHKGLHCYVSTDKWPEGPTFMAWIDDVGYQNCGYVNISSTVAVDLEAARKVFITKAADAKGYYGDEHWRKWLAQDMPIKQVHEALDFPPLVLYPSWIIRAWENSSVVS